MAPLGCAQMPSLPGKLAPGLTAQSPTPAPLRSMHGQLGLTQGQAHHLAHTLVSSPGLDPAWPFPLAPLWFIRELLQPKVLNW